MLGVGVGVRVGCEFGGWLSMRLLARRLVHNHGYHLQRVVYLYTLYYRVGADRGFLKSSRLVRNYLVQHVVYHTLCFDVIVYVDVVLYVDVIVCFDHTLRLFLA